MIENIYVTKDILKEGYSNFKRFKLNSNYNLYYNSNLRTIISGDNILIGSAEEADINKPLIKNQLENLEFKSNFREITSTWMGRYILFIDNKIITDFYCSYNLYENNNIFSDNPFNKLNEPILSPFSYIEIEKDSFLVKNLTGRIFKKYNDLTYKEIKGRVKYLLEGYSSRLEREKVKAILPLTAGRDSRLSMCYLSNIINYTYTFSKPFRHFTVGDLLMPKIISKIFKKNHFLINKIIDFESKLKIGGKIINKKESIPGDYFYYTLHGHWHQLNSSKKTSVVTSLFFDLIEGSYANYIRDYEWINFSTKSDYDENDFNELLKKSVKYFEGFSQQEYLEKGLHYLIFRYKSLHKSMKSIETGGFCNIIALGICQEINSLGMSLSRKDLVKSKLIIDLCDLKVNILKYLPINPGPREINLYISKLNQYIWKR